MQQPPGGGGVDVINRTRGKHGFIQISPEINDYPKYCHIIEDSSDEILVTVSNKQ